MTKILKDTDKITYLQKVAAEGEVAFTLCTSPHNAEMKYRIYIVLKAVNKTSRPLFIQLFKDMTTIPENDIDKIVLAIENNDVPIWLWLERTVADIELALYSSDYTIPTCSKLSIEKKSIKESVVKSSFNMFVRKVGLLCPKSAKLLCNYILNETNLKFLYPICCYMLSGELKELEEARPPKSSLNSTILDMSFDPKDLMSFNIETKTLAKIDSALKKFKKTSKEEEDTYEKIARDASNEISELFGIPVEESVEDTIFVVMKTFNGSNLTTRLRAFDTQEEALNFIEEIEKNSPEIINSCTLEILKEKRK